MILFNINNLFAHSLNGFQVFQFNISNSTSQIFLSNLIWIICLHIVQWFPTFLSNINNLFAHSLNGFKYSYLTLVILLMKYSYIIWIICTQSYYFKYLIITILSTWLNSSVWSIDGILTGTTNLGQSEHHKSNDKKEVLRILQSFHHHSTSCHTQDTEGKGESYPSAVI